MLTKITNAHCRPEKSTKAIDCWTTVSEPDLASMTPWTDSSLKSSTLWSQSGWWSSGQEWPGFRRDNCW